VSNSHKTTPLRAVFLDAGGTIIHLDRAFILEALATRGLLRTEAQFKAADEAARRRVGVIMRSGEASDDTSRWHTYMQTVLQELTCSGADAEYVRELVTQRHREGRLWSKTVEGTAAALETLRSRGLTLGVVSNADGRVASFIQHAGLIDHVDFVIDSGAVGVEKPHPGIFRIACERAGVQPHETVHVGDIYEIDVIGARAAGIRAILIDPEGRHAGTDCDSISSITELPAFLERIAC
jgi:HAD superfamily hydrolase (TIGR01549 family)